MHIRIEQQMQRQRLRNIPRRQTPGAACQQLLGWQILQGGHTVLQLYHTTDKTTLIDNKAVNTQLIRQVGLSDAVVGAGAVVEGDRKSTRLNSSHVKISYAVFCLKKKN